MIKAGNSFLFRFFILCLFFLVEVQESQSELIDAPNQCGAFCMSALHPLFDHHVKHQQQWSSLASVMNDTRARLEKLQHDTQAKLDEMQTQLAAIIEALAMINSSTNTKKESLSDKFEQIGSRRFYIERDEKDTWDNAASKCLLMGGYLASFRNKEELEAILPKLEALEEYWLGINNREDVNQFISVASGASASFLQWKPVQPLYSPDISRRVVYLHFGSMGVGWSDIKCKFICQADNEV